MSYRAIYRESIEDPVGFWGKQAEAIAWYTRPATVLTEDGTWFPDGELNTAYLALDHHVETGRGEQLALVYDSPVTGSKQQCTFTELRDAVALFAGALANAGIGKGDRVVIYMPMIPETVVAMLACARLGAIHSVVFGGFAAPELASRIDDAKPALILTASCGIEFSHVIAYKPLVDEARRLAVHKVPGCVVFQRPECVAELQAGDRDWTDFLQGATAADCVPVRGSDPLYILYTSGTTGKPKGVVRDNGGHAVALRYSMDAVYGVAPGEVFWAASDVGWVVGHSYIVYAPLLAGCTTILFEGKPVRTPDAGTFWRIIDDYRVNVFFTAPTAFRAVRKEDPDGSLLAGYDVSSLRTVFVAGERTDPSTYEWLVDLLGVPVIDHWWQTETGWAIAGNPLGIEQFPARAGSATFPMPGFDVRILSEDHTPAPAGKEGDVVIRLPLPPGCLPTVWGNHERFVTSYLTAHPGYYQTGDGGYFDEQGYLFIMGRTDDVINVAGHRLSTGEMEEIVASHGAVAECAVIGIEDADKGQVPAGLIVLKDGANVSEAELEQELVGKVRREIGAFANFKRTVVVGRLPKTRSGKILRQVMRKIADGKPYDLPATIDDPAILDEIAVVFRDKRIGIAGAKEG
ncbi:MAG: propionyl-CoA synthetase [Pseudomonadota bacterium]